LKTNRLLAGTLALVLIAGLGTPAFAEGVLEIDVENSEIVSTAELPLPTNLDDDIVFETPGDPILTTKFQTSNFIIVGDFILDEETVITDFHFVFDDSFWDGTMKYFVYADDERLPGARITSGDAQKIEMELISGDNFMTWFDLEEPITLDADTRFWFGLHTSETFEPGGTGMAASTQTFEEKACALNEDDSLFTCTTSEVWFQLSGHPPDVVGGELLPIETTSLLLAAAQSPASWLTTLTIAALGIGVYVFTRNPNNMRNIKVILRDYLDRL